MKHPHISCCMASQIRRRSWQGPIQRSLYGGSSGWPRSPENKIVFSWAGEPSAPSPGQKRIPRPHPPCNTTRNVLHDVALVNAAQGHRRAPGAHCPCANERRQLLHRAENARRARCAERASCTICTTMPNGARPVRRSAGVPCGAGSCRRPWRFACRPG